jgi:DNA-binding MarR family transcriptional regulator
MSAVKARVDSREAALTDLGTAFKGAMAAVRRLRGRDTQRPGELAFAQYQLLFGLAGHGELSTSELAVTADLAPATVTQMLDSLVTMGHVERKRSDRDRRIVTCSLTKSGERVVAERRRRYEGRWKAALAEFTTRELATTAAVLDRLKALFEEIDAEATNARPAA